MIEAEDIKNAARRIAPYIHQTPIFTNHFFNAHFGAELFFKAENLQKTGSFKARGATNSVLKLTEAEKRKGVATHSSGNHGQALAWAAAQQGIPAYIVMPENAPAVKVKAVEGYGAEIVFCKPNLAAREESLEKTMQEKGAVFIPPYNYKSTIEGQATAALEILNSHSDLDFILAPVGGGGLLSGTALSASFFSEKTRVIGCEPFAADDAARSFKAGKLIPVKDPNTIADGLRTSLGDLTFSYISRLAEDIITCSESAIVDAMKLIWERMKLVVEPSAAVPLACMMEEPGRWKGKKVAIILSGGNVDVGKLPF